MTETIVATMDLSTTAAEELACYIMLELARALRPMTEKAKHGRTQVRLLACDFIANLLEWGRRALPELGAVPSLLCTGGFCPGGGLKAKNVDSQLNPSTS